MDAPQQREVIDRPTGIGISDTHGHIVISGLPCLSDLEQETLQHLMGIWKYGLLKDDETAEHVAVILV